MPLAYAGSQAACVLSPRAATCKRNAAEHPLELASIKLQNRAQSDSSKGVDTVRPAKHDEPQNQENGTPANANSNTQALDAGGDNCFCQHRHRICVQPGDVQAAVTDHVDTVFFAHFHDQFGRRTEAGKHATVFGDKAEAV